MFWCVSPVLSVSLNCILLIFGYPEYSSNLFWDRCTLFLSKCHKTNTRTILVFFLFFNGPLFISLCNCLHRDLPPGQLFESGQTDLVNDNMAMKSPTFNILMYTLIQIYYSNHIVNQWLSHLTCSSPFIRQKCHRTFLLLQRKMLEVRSSIKSENSLPDNL